LATLWFQTPFDDTFLKIQSTWGTNLDVCDCYGVTCETTGVVSALRLENIVRGHIPDDLALLTGLTLLELVLSDELVGTIPSSLENLTILRRLALNNNRLSGTIPPSLFGSSLTALTDLYVFNNVLTGIIPSSSSLASSFSALVTAISSFPGSSRVTLTVH
jgi:hypothetical protein